MSSTVVEHPTGSSEPSDWGEIGARLTAEFPQFAVSDVLVELVHAHDAANYVGTPEHEIHDVVEFMARYALMVRCGQVSPSDRLDPERHASPRRG
jgi:hypothetical protein